MVGPAPQDRSDDAVDRYVDAALVPGGDVADFAEPAGLDADVAAAVAALRSLTASPAPDVAERHLTRLLSERADVVDLASGRRRRLLASGAAGVVLATTLLAGVGTAAAADALPGDRLYGLKTARERVELALARDGDGKAAVHLRHAHARLDEAAELLQRGDVTDGVATLGRADAALAAAQAAGSATLDQRAEEELGRRVEVLGALLDGGLPTQAADAAREALARALSRERGEGDRPDRDTDARPGDPGSGRPTNAPTGRPTAAPGQSQRPTAAPGASNRPSEPGRRPSERPSASKTPGNPGRPGHLPTPAAR